MTNLTDNDYVLIDGAAWFTVGNFAIRIHKTSEGIDCAIYANGREDRDPLATCYAMDSDLGTG